MLAENLSAADIINGPKRQLGVIRYSMYGWIVGNELYLLVEVLLFCDNYIRRYLFPKFSIFMIYL